MPMIRTYMVSGKGHGEINPNKDNINNNNVGELNEKEIF